MSTKIPPMGEIPISEIKSMEIVIKIRGTDGHTHTTVLDATHGYLLGVSPGSGEAPFTSIGGRVMGIANCMAAIINTCEDQLPQEALEMAYAVALGLLANGIQPEVRAAMGGAAVVGPGALYSRDGTCTCVTLPGDTERVATNTTCPVHGHA